MKLVTFSLSDGDSRVGVLTENGIVDASGLFPSMMALLQAGDAGLAAVRAAANAAETVYPQDDVTLQAPIGNPGKVLAIGLNYADHIAEFDLKQPEYQLWFNKQRNCINGPYAPINLPSVSSELDYEAEMVLVIGKRAKHVPRERAHEVIAGYCCGNDVSVRDWQEHSPTWQMGKSFDTHGPIGPYLMTPDEIGDPHDLDIRSYVNGEVRQSSNTRNLVFDCFDAIAYLTQAFTLDVGDVLFMGTPGGVGAASTPPNYLKAGDVVKVEIDKLGFIENTVVPEDARCEIS